jgi:hypothetical protein
MLNPSTQTEDQIKHLDNDEEETFIKDANKPTLLSAQQNLFEGFEGVTVINGDSNPKTQEKPLDDSVLRNKSDTSTYEIVSENQISTIKALEY